jgi:hypothetical protein
MVPLIVAGGLMAGGTVANYMGGENEAKRRSGAIKQYERDSARIHDNMLQDDWSTGQERQRGTGRVLTHLSSTMNQPGEAAPDVASYLPSTPEGSVPDAYRAAMAQGANPRVALSQTGVDATQAGMDREAMIRALDALGFSATVEGQTNAPQHARYQWQQRRDLADARARLESVLGSISNKTRNLQLLGSLLNTGGQATMMGAAMSGGPTNTPPVTPAESQVGGMFGIY